MANGCGNRKCGRSSGIDGSITYGTGELDDYGFWEFPCEPCKMANRVAKAINTSDIMIPGGRALGYTSTVRVTSSTPTATLGRRVATTVEVDLPVSPEARAFASVVLDAVEAYDTAAATQTLDRAAQANELRIEEMFAIFDEFAVRFPISFEKYFKTHQTRINNRLQKIVNKEIDDAFARQKAEAEAEPNMGY